MQRPIAVILSHFVNKLLYKYRYIFINFTSYYDGILMVIRLE